MLNYPFSSSNFTDLSNMIYPLLFLYLLSSVPCSGRNTPASAPRNRTAPCSAACRSSTLICSSRLTCLLVHQACQRHFRLHDRVRLRRLPPKVIRVAALSHVHVQPLRSLLVPDLVPVHVLKKWVPFQRLVGVFPAL